MESGRRGFVARTYRFGERRGLRVNVAGGIRKGSGNLPFVNA
jgi:hypothetical protein